MTQHYDTALAPSGLRTTQFSVLTIPRRLQPISLGAFAEYLVMDRAALGHNVRPLERTELRLTLKVVTQMNDSPIIISDTLSE